MTFIESAWYGFWTGAGSLLAWAFAARLLPHHTSTARLLGAIVGLLAAHILPRLLVHYLIELPRARRPSPQIAPAITAAPVPALPTPSA